MQIMLTTLAFALAFVCAVVMGYAIQRGATCTVAAVDEVVAKRKTRRLVSLLEASVWVAGGLLIANALGWAMAMPPNRALSAWTVGGGLLLGLGAYVNRACVFGAIARFGSGEWAYAATPLGFYLGCLTVGAVFGTQTPAAAGGLSPLLTAPVWVAGVFALFAVWRIGAGWRMLRRAYAENPRARWTDVIAKRVWAPHAATTVIGIAFIVMLLAVGAWAYTDALVDLARGGMTGNQVGRLLLFVGLLGGAVWGGWTAGRFSATRPTATQLLRCLAGGALMGWGSLLIPGSNDGLILIGLPLLYVYAWIAFASMCAAIAAAQLLARRGASTASRAPAPGSANR